MPRWTVIPRPPSPRPQTTSVTLACPVDTERLELLVAVGGVADVVDRRRRQPEAVRLQHRVTEVAVRRLDLLPGRLGVGTLERRRLGRDLDALRVIPRLPGIRRVAGTD